MSGAQGSNTRSSPARSYEVTPTNPSPSQQLESQQKQQTNTSYGFQRIDVLGTAASDLKSQTPFCFPAGATHVEKMDWQRAERLVQFLARASKYALLAGSMGVPLLASSCCRWPLALGNAWIWALFAWVIHSLLKLVDKQKRQQFEQLSVTTRDNSHPAATMTLSPRDNQAGTLELDYRKPWKVPSSGLMSASKETKQLEKGDSVEVTNTFDSDSTTAVQLLKGEIGIVKDIDKDGDAVLEFEGHETKEWVFKKNFKQLRKVKLGLAPTGWNMALEAKPPSRPSLPVHWNHFQLPMKDEQRKEDAWSPLDPVVGTQESAWKWFKRQIRGGTKPKQKATSSNAVSRPKESKAKRVAAPASSSVAASPTPSQGRASPGALASPLSPLPPSSDRQAARKEDSGAGLEPYRLNETFALAEQAEGAPLLEEEEKVVKRGKVRCTRCGVLLVCFVVLFLVMLVVFGPKLAQVVASKAERRPPLEVKSHNVGSDHEGSHAPAPSVSPKTKPKRALWRAGNWGTCSASCGSGTAKRKVTCSAADDSDCDADDKPDAVQHCTDLSHCKWKASDWSDCSSKCGSGDQRRSVKCVNGDNDSCTQSKAVRPNTTQACHYYGGCRWQIGEWSTCSTDCGSGQRERYVKCLEGKGGTETDDKHCGTKEERPNREKDCTEISGCNYEIGEWGACSSQCGHGVQKRATTCDGEDGSVKVSDCLKKYGEHIKEKVLMLTAGRMKRKCYEVKGCAWSTGNWSKCSAECGKGIKTRKVWCGNGNESQCEAGANQSFSRKAAEIWSSSSTKPNNEATCASYKGCVWDAAEWSSCSVGCGHGQQTRKAPCLNGRDEDCKLVESQPDTKRGCIADDGCEWKALDWEACSALCGPGLQERKVECFDTISKAAVQQHSCRRNTSAGEMPGHQRACNGKSCRGWNVGEWGNCTGICGSRTMTRLVECSVKTSCDLDVPEATASCASNLTECAMGELFGEDTCPCDGEDWTLIVAGSLNAVCGWAIIFMGLMCFVYMFTDGHKTADLLQDVSCSCCNGEFCVKLLGTLQLLVLNSLSPLVSLLAVFGSFFTAWLLGSFGITGASVLFDGCTPGVRDVVVESGRFSAAFIALAVFSKAWCVLTAHKNVAPRAIWLGVAVLLFIMFPFALIDFSRALFQAYWAHVHFSKPDVSFNTFEKEAETGIHKDFDS